MKEKMVGWDACHRKCILLFGCGKRQETRDDKVHIGVIITNQSDTFLNELLARFKEQLKNPEHEELEATVDIRCSGHSAHRMIR
ncbi:MAG: hypothetical protein ACLTCI_04095 [[Clostridium] nexile]